MAIHVNKMITKNRSAVHAGITMHHVRQTCKWSGMRCYLIIPETRNTT